MTGVPKKETMRRMIDALEGSLREHPHDRKVLHHLALAYFKAGLFSRRAMTIYERAGEVYPTDISIQRAISIGYMVNQGEALLADLPALEDLDREALNRSIEKMAELADQFPESPEIHRAMGDLRLIAGDYREALQAYRSALALGVDDLEPLCRLFETLDALFPAPPNVVAFFAEVYQRAARLEKAHALYRRLIEEGEEVDHATLNSYHRFLGRRLEQFAHDREKVESLTRECCQVCLLLGRPKEALDHARKVGPDALAENPPLVRKLARQLIDMEDFRLAFEHLSRIPMDHETKGLINEIGVLLEQRGELDTAAYVLKYMNEHDEISPGETKLRPKREESREESEELSETQLLEIETALQMAQLHWRKKQWQECFSSYILALERGITDYRSILEPLDSLLDRLPKVDERELAKLAHLFAERRDWERTLFYAERALHLDPTMDDIRHRLIQSCEQLLLRDPDKCDVRLKLGDVQLDRNNIERAMKEYRKVQARPEYSMKANRRIAIAHFRGGNYKASLEKFNELAVLEPDDLEGLYDLMIAFQAGEQWRYALEAAQRIIEFDPGFRDVSNRIDEYQGRINATSADINADPKMRELIGDHSIGRYRYADRVGSGGMGVVYKVLDLKTDTYVAMKILREGLASSDKAIDRFIREARIAASLRHRNIVSILDFNIANTSSQSYIAMEFVDGPSLRDIVEDKFAKSFDIDLQYILEVLDWMIQACDALSATHAKGIIHRDIKPDNIMIGPGSIVKLTDFGIVHIEDATFTPTGALIGTPRYMSPEQVHGGRVDARSDIYSLGIIIYEMLVGSPPFISGDIAYQQVNVLPTRLREICETIPDLVDALVMRCLEKNSSDRFSDANDLRSSLEDTFVRLGGNPGRLDLTRFEETGVRGELMQSGTNPDDILREHTASSPFTRTGARLAPTSGFDELASDLDLDLSDEDPDRIERHAPRSRTANPIFSNSTNVSSPPPAPRRAHNEQGIETEESAPRDTTPRSMVEPSPPPEPPKRYQPKHLSASERAKLLHSDFDLDLGGSSPAAKPQSAAPELDSALEDLDLPPSMIQQPAPPPAQSRPVTGLEDISGFDFDFDPPTPNPVSHRAAPTKGPAPERPAKPREAPAAKDPSWALEDLDLDLAESSGALSSGEARGSSSRTATPKQPKTDATGINWDELD